MLRKIIINPNRLKILQHTYNSSYNRCTKAAALGLHRSVHSKSNTRITQTQTPSLKDFIAEAAAELKEQKSDIDLNETKVPYLDSEASNGNNQKGKILTPTIGLFQFAVLFNINIISFSIFRNIRMSDECQRW